MNVGDPEKGFLCEDGRQTVVATDALAEKLAKNLKTFRDNDLLGEELKHRFNKKMARQNLMLLSN